MPWFQVDDGFAFHRKAVRAGNAALGLWVRAGSWCAQHLTDGYIPEEMVDVLGSEAQASKLVSAGLWIPVDKGVDKGYQFHQWTEDGRNPSREKVISKRREDAERKRASRDSDDALSEGPQVTPTGHNRTPDGLHMGLLSGLQTSTPLHSTPTSPKGEVTTSRSSELFAKFWAAYPRKIGKKAAEKAWARALRAGADPEVLVRAADAYAVQRKGQDQKFTPHASTWLNGGRWEDEPDRPQLRAVGDYQPFQSNRDPSAWEEDL